jgi:hypothetical protein
MTPHAGVARCKRNFIRKQDEQTKIDTEKACNAKRE